VPGTGTNGASSNDDETVKLVFVKRNDAFANLLDARLGTASVERGTRRAIILNEQSDGSALTKTPQPGDALIGVGDSVTVNEARTLRAGGETIAYVMEVQD